MNTNPTRRELLRTYLVHLKAQNTAEENQDWDVAEFEETRKDRAEWAYYEANGQEKTVVTAGDLLDEGKTVEEVLDLLFGG